MYFHQAETNVAAHRMSSYEEARWRDEGVDPELLYEPTVVTVTEASSPQTEHLDQSAHRPLSVDAAAQVMQAAEVFVHDPATVAVNRSFNWGM